MNTHRNPLPQLADDIFITDGGLETTLIFDQGHDLPEVAAFDIFRKKDGYRILHDYFLPYIDLARNHRVGFILESPTWRASRDWGRKIGYTPGELAEMNHTAIALLSDLRRDWETDDSPMVISGCIGPRGDGYQIAEKMTIEEAKSYHQEQIDTLGRTAADLVSAFTINYVEEAIGIVLAAQSARIPVVISFTVETDGHLPSGQPLGEAIQAVDAATDNGPAYYMINCAHPTHFAEALATGESWVRRVRAIRANASNKSHDELDGSDELDAGDPTDLGARYAELKRLLPHLNIFGGCCGTDLRHVTEICKSVTLN